MTDAPKSLEPFARAASVSGASQFLASRRFQAFVQSQLRELDPNLVSLDTLRGMDTHPTVYLAERTLTGVVRRPDLYYVRHPDRRVVLETEEWLWPLLPAVLSAIARAYVFGAVPMIFNWGQEALVVGKERFEHHVHYVSAHELWPGDVTIDHANDELISLRYGKRRYPAERAHVFVWDRAFGSWKGKAARRRAWPDYCRSLSTEVLQLRYLERSVDLPRVGFAPGGETNPEGDSASAIDHMNELLVELRGSGAITLPSERDEKGERYYGLDVLNLPDRQNVWDRALNRYDAGILRAYLVPPRLGGLEDIGASGARTLDGMLKEFIQDLAQFAADELTRLVAKVHRVNHDETRVPPPEIKAYEVPATIRKLYLEVLRLVSSAQREESPADWVDVPALLDQLGVPLRSEPLPPQPASGSPGRPRDLTGGREARREEARTDEGESSVGRPATDLRSR